MQSLSKAFQALLARIQRDTDAAGGVWPGEVISVDPRRIQDGGERITYGVDRRPDYVREMEANGWELLVTLSDKSTPPSAR